MGMATKKFSGFTIVELLIVIVIIGILATITVIAYNGIQSRARSSQLYTTIQQYYKGLQIYESTYYTYPNYGSACFTEVSGPCYFGDHQPNAGFTNALKSVMGSPLPVVPNTVEKPLYLGPGFGWTVDGKARAFILYQVDPGASKCDFGAPVLAGPGPNLSSSNTSTTFSMANKRECYIPLPL
jgi:prepilin-type N-terminal cleavage/methylation domain-containing protein